MSKLAIRWYRLTGNEGADFEIGEEPQLDPIDGFGDDQRQFHNGERLSFIVTGGITHLLTDIQTAEEASQIRAELNAIPVISGSITGAYGKFSVESKRPLGEILSSTGDSENKWEDGRFRLKHKSVQERITLLQERWAEYPKEEGRLVLFDRGGWKRSWGVVCELPTMPTCKNAVENGLSVAYETELLDWGKERFIPVVNAPDLSMGRQYRVSSVPIFVDHSVNTGTFRVFVFQQFHSACYVFEINDVDVYEKQLNKALAESRSRKEAEFWTLMLN
jgi:hypothetical protein